MEDDGALCVFPPGFENRHGEPLPLIVRKSDGGYGYSATDLAAVRDRTGRLGATRLVYVVGAEQSLHLRWSSPWPPWPDTCPTVRRPSTSASAWCSGRTARSWPAAAVTLRAPHRPALRGGGACGRGVEGARAASCLRTAGGGGPRARHRRGQVRRPLHGARSATTSSTGTACWPSRATPVRTSSTPTPASARSSAAPRPTRPPPAATPAARRASGARAGAAAPALRRGGGGDGADTRARRSCAPTSSTWPASFTAFYEACRVLVDDEAVRVSRLGSVRPHGPGARAGLSLLGMEAPEQM